MSDYSGLADLVEQIKAASENIEKGDAKFAHRLDAIETSVNQLYLKAQRPGGFDGDSLTDERKSAIEMCRMRHNEHVPKTDLVTTEYRPSGDEIEEATVRFRASCATATSIASTARSANRFPLYAKSLGRHAADDQRGAAHRRRDWETRGTVESELGNPNL